jgi:uncharacterized protein (TIGR02246 family)
MPVQPTMHDEVAVRQLVKDCTDAWNRHDAIAYGQPFAEDASYRMISGRRIQGRAAITHAQREFFDAQGKGSRIETRIESIRFIRSDVAFVETVSHLYSVVSPLEAMVAAIVSLKVNGEWRIVIFSHVGVLTDLSNLETDAGCLR